MKKIVFNSSPYFIFLSLNENIFTQGNSSAKGCFTWRPAMTSVRHTLFLYIPYFLCARLCSQHYPSQTKVMAELLNWKHVPCSEFRAIMPSLLNSTIWYKARLRKYIHTVLCEVITHPYPKFNCGLVELPLKLRHGWIIKSHKKLDAVINPCPNS